MTATRKTIHQWISTGTATAAIAIASLAFQASSIAAPDAETLSAEARASLERQLAIAREERDALVLETEGQIAELTETLEAERADAAALRDQLATAESAQADAKAKIAELTRRSKLNGPKRPRCVNNSPPPSRHRPKLRRRSPN